MFRPRSSAIFLSFPHDSMTPSDEPALAPPPDVTLLPSPPAVSSPSDTTTGRLGPVLILLVAALAFVLASFPARNSDLWRHLAAGRHLVHGDGAARFAALAGQGWLYDLVGYGLSTTLGGAGLVVAKALLVAALALVLLRLSRARQEDWSLPVLCTALALVAMSTRLLLQPATVSVLFLALMLWMLQRREEREPQGISWLPPWPLTVLFVVWANVDGWFVLGLAAVALVGLGRALDLARQGQAKLVSLSSRLLVSLAVLGVVCLLNPAHVHAFALPPELRALARPGVLGAGTVASPFRAAYLANVGVSPASLAYYPLLALGLLSFVFAPRWQWQRFLPWAGLALLSAVQVRAVPFFAVVAGPVLAWNLQEALAPYFDRQRNSPAFGHGLTAFLVVILLACAWPGWLQAPPYEPRRWAVETDPSLERAAAAVCSWHREGKLRPDDKGLHFSPETAHAFAWFCPEEKGLVDGALAAAVLGDPDAPTDGDRELRAVGINHVIVYDADRGRLFETLGRLLSDPAHWPLLYLEGDLAVFGWRDGAEAKADPFRMWQLSLDRLAFRPAEDKKAPPKRSERDPEVRPFWEAFWKAAPPRPLDRDEADLHLAHAEALRRSAPFRHKSAWEDGQSAALVAAAAGWGGGTDVLDAYLRLVRIQPPLPEQDTSPDKVSIPVLGAIALQERFTRQQDDTPPALLFLAVRAARRALAANPDDARAYLSLGESYLRLLHGTRERAWSERMPELAQLRRSQASAALSQAVALRPDFAQAHLSLGGLYREMGYLDLSLIHLQAYLKLAGETGPPPGVSAKDFREQEARYQEDLNRLAKEAEKRENSFATAAAGARVLDRANLAVRHGLGGKALDILLASDIAAFGPQGMELELELLLRTGRAKDVRDWTSSEHEAALGSPSYHWMRAQALAASGDYALARDECAELTRSIALPGQGQEPVRFREVMALTVGQALLEEQPAAPLVPSLRQRLFSRLAFQNRVPTLARNLRQEADTRVLAGLLALEQGEVGDAEDAFRAALALYRDDATALSGGGLDFNGRVVAQSALAWLEE